VELPERGEPIRRSGGGAEAQSRKRCEPEREPGRKPRAEALVGIQARGETGAALRGRGESEGARELEEDRAVIPSFRDEARADRLSLGFATEEERAAEEIAPGREAQTEGVGVGDGARRAGVGGEAVVVRAHGDGGVERPPEDVCLELGAESARARLLARER